MEVDLDGVRWRLLPERAAWQPDERLLVVADVHLGKAASFRALGVPVPGGTTAANLARLSGLLAAHQPATLAFLGDLFHARPAHDAPRRAALAAWRARHPALRCVLVEGNHDRRAGPAARELDLERVEQPWFAAGAALCHEPQFVDGATVLAGHLHPAVTLWGRAGDALRVPCFWLRRGLWVLPAFGEFTGSASFEREAGDRVLAIGGERLFEVPPRPRR